MAESRVEYLSSRGMCTDDPSLMIVVDVEWLKPLIKELIILNFFGTNFLTLFVN